jgi:hypothetical protein
MNRKDRAYKLEQIALCLDDINVRLQTTSHNLGNLHCASELKKINIAINKILDASRSLHTNVDWLSREITREDENEKP